MTPSVENDVPEVSDARRHYNKLAKTRQRKIFDINSLLGKVEEKEKTKILGRALGSHQESFLKATINYFRTLIKDGRGSFKSKVEGAQLILKIFGDKIDETDFQLWLANALNVDLNDLITSLTMQKRISQLSLLVEENSSVLMCVNLPITFGR